jgi:hypothetical protein
MNTDTLLEPQKDHAKRLLNSLHINGFAFDASPTGTGKTYVASSIALNLSLPVVVVCPKVAKKTWNDTLAKFNITPYAVINYEKLTRGNTPYYKFDKKEYVNSKYWWESKGISVHFPKNCLVIVDECHKAKGINSKNGEMVTALKNNGYKVLLLSATAATNVTEMRSFGYVTNLHSGKNFYHFAKDNGADTNIWGHLVWDKTSTIAKKGMLNIHNTLFNIQECASKMNIDDFGTIFPDNNVIAESFDIGSEGSKKLQAAYDKMEEELARLDDRAQNYSEHVFAIIMKARRMSEILKVPVTTDWIEDCVENDISPVVFFNFTDTLESVESRLSSKFAGMITKIVGGQTEKERNLEIAEFQSDKRRIALVNMNAGSACISLHDLNGIYPRHSLICPSWSAIMTLQAIGRIHRANGKSKCIQKFLFASEIEERQRAKVAAKIKNISELNDGDLSLVEAVPLY